MQEINQKISQLIDDELDIRQAQALLRQIQADPALQAKLQRYQLLGQALKNDKCIILDKHFAEKIHQQISQEPSYLISRKSANPNPWLQRTGLALAASILLAVMWLAGNQQNQRNPLPALVFLAPQLDPAPAVNPRLNEYLQAHDNTLYSNHTSRVQPYARVVGYQQE